MAAQQLLYMVGECPTPTRRDGDPRQDHILLALLAVKSLNCAKHLLEITCCGSPEFSLGRLLLLLSLCPLLLKLPCQLSNPTRQPALHCLQLLAVHDVLHNELILKDLLLFCELLGEVGLQLAKLLVQPLNSDRLILVRALCGARLSALRRLGRACTVQTVRPTCDQRVPLDERKQVGRSASPWTLPRRAPITPLPFAV